MERSKIEGLLKLFLADGLSPNIKVVKIRVREDWEGNLVVDSPFEFPEPEISRSIKEKISYQEEAVNLEEYNVEGVRFLAGFSELGYSLIVGSENDNKNHLPG